MIKKAYDFLFYCLFDRIKTTDSEVPTIIYLSVLLLINIFSIFSNFYFFDSLLTSKFFVYGILTFFLIFNIFYFEKNKYYIKIIKKYNQNKSKYINIVGLFYPIVSFLYLMFVFDVDFVYMIIITVVLLIIG